MALEDGACHRERGQAGGIISSSGGDTCGQVGKFVCVGCHKRSWEGMTVWLYDWKRGWQDWQEYVLHHFFLDHPHWSLWLINECQSLRTALLQTLRDSLPNRFPEHSSGVPVKTQVKMDGGWRYWIELIERCLQIQQVSDGPSRNHLWWINYSRHFDDEFSIHFNLETSRSSQTWTCHNWPWWGQV